jgi:hypothetical protein
MGALKVALSPLVSSLRGVSSKQLRQDFAARINTAAMRGQVLVPVILRPIMGRGATVHCQGLHHQPQTTRLSTVSCLP